MSLPPPPGDSPEFQPPSGYGWAGSGWQQPDRHAYSLPNAYPQPAPYPQIGPPSPLPPAPYPPVGPPAPAPLPPAPWPVATVPQRPATVGLAVTMTATASLQWVCALAFCWLVAVSGARRLGTTGVDGSFFHMLNRFNYRMLDGLAWPLFLFPVASLVLGFLLLTRQWWARLAFTALGVIALLWSAWWLRNDLSFWLPAACYIAVAVLLVWSPQTNRWFRPASGRAGQPS